jgi:hypothetical protein
MAGFDLANSKLPTGDNVAWADQGTKLFLYMDV